MFSKPDFLNYCTIFIDFCGKTRFLYKKKLGTLFAIIISVSFAYRNEKL